MELQPQWVKRIVREKKGFHVCFIADKILTSSDLNVQQNRFLIPKEFVFTNVCPALVVQNEIRNAGLLEEQQPYPNLERCNHDVGEGASSSTSSQVSLMPVGSSMSDRCCGDTSSKSPIRLPLFPSEGSSSSSAGVPLMPVAPSLTDAAASMTACMASEGCMVPAILPGVPLMLYTKGGWSFGPVTLKRWESSGATIINGHNWEIFNKFSGLKPGQRVQVWSFRTPVVKETNISLNFIIGEIDSDHNDQSCSYDPAA